MIIYFLFLEKKKVTKKIQAKSKGTVFMRKGFCDLAFEEPADGRAAGRSVCFLFFEITDCAAFSLVLFMDVKV